MDSIFNNDSQSSQIKGYIENMTGVTNIQFKNIEDFLVLIIFLLKQLDATATELKRIIHEFEESVKLLEGQIPNSSFFQILGSDVNNKLNQVKEYVSKN